jgi:hypothetical protein
VGVIPSDLGRLLDGLHTLAVQDGRTWVRVTADALALGTVQGGIEQMPDALEAEAPEMVEDGLPRREVAWQIAPGAAGTQDVEDGIENRAQ